MERKPIATASRNAITSAFFQLMQQYSYSEITISEIASTAGSSRRTFYRHFNDKEDVIQQYMQITSAEYEKNIQQKGSYDNVAIAESIFSIFQKQKDVLIILVKQNLSHLILKEMEASFSKYQEQFATQEERNHPHRKYLLAYHIAGFWNIMMKWLSSGCKETPVEMAAIIEQAVSSAQI